MKTKTEATEPMTKEEVDAIDITIDKVEQHQQKIYIKKNINFSEISFLSQLFLTIEELTA
ncbi:hypothetical protein [Peribacillus simplex]|uniref:hypothetical protein n=1 Tax=Peribacillus TaxID=2675229 RepID=UPI0036DCA755